MRQALGDCNECEKALRGNIHNVMPSTVSSSPITLFPLFSVRFPIDYYLVLFSSHQSVPAVETGSLYAPSNTPVGTRGALQENSAPLPNPFRSTMRVGNT